eukprot:2296330-Lingulodinium_polyedra.AAC.1
MGNHAPEHARRRARGRGRQAREGKTRRGGRPPAPRAAAFSSAAVPRDAVLTESVAASKGWTPRPEAVK